MNWNGVIDGTVIPRKVFMIRAYGILFAFILLIGPSGSDALAGDAGHVPQRSWRKLPSPEVAGWSVAKLKSAREFSETIDTAALMIVQDGVVVDEWGQTALSLKCHSVRKSLLSALFGQHVESGTIDLDQTLAEMGIDDSEPSLTSAERQARIRDLLKARSGVYHPALYETKAMAAARPKRGSHEPDSFWYYNNWDFNASGNIFENLTGRSIFEEFEDRIAGPLGMEDFDRARHTRYVTGDDSVHPAYPFQLSTRDLARFGLLFLRNGRWGERQVIPEAWVRDSTASYSDVGSSGGYGYMWWVAVDGRHFPGVTLPPGSYSARGYRGQYLVVIPKWSIVVAHRVNSYQSGTAVSKSDFGKLLSLIFEARPKPAQEDSKQTDSTSSENADSPQFDTIIRNGEVIDGTGRERFRADVAIRADRVVQIGNLADSTADRVIDATCRLIAPGFIDLHSHAEKGLVAEDPARRSAPNLITQGITTVVVNQDGGGPLDLVAQRQAMRQLGTGLNVVQVLGHGTIRRAVMGDDHRRPATEAELKAMQQHLLTALRGGAFGMSAGLEYVPGRWSTPREMEALAKTVAEFNGVYIVHERSSGSRPMWFLPSRDPAEQPSMVDNIHELIDVAASTRVTTVATHIKARGTDFWGSSDRMNELLRLARDDGLPIYADQYPYNTSGSDGRIVLIPAWAFQSSEPRISDEGKTGAADKTDYASRLKTVLEDEAKSEKLRRDVEYEITRRGGADSILIVEHQNPEVTGKTLAEFSATKDVSPVEAAIRLQLEGDRSRRGGARLRAFSMSEKDVEAFAAAPWTATSSDAGIALPKDGPVHPRFYGAFPRKIRRYAIDRGLMTIEEAVRVSTSLPAHILGLSDRGELRVGQHADLVVFDPETIRDKADAFDPHQFAEGIDYVFVNGRTAVEKGLWLGTFAGSVIVKSRETAPEALTNDKGTRTR
jgi:N-acyl-D-amino-acid deacylase